MATNGLQRGSLSWHCAQLPTGGIHLVADKGDPGTAQLQNIATTLSRLQKKVEGKWQVQTCWGQPFAHRGLEKSFRFYKIARIK